MCQSNPVAAKACYHTADMLHDDVQNFKQNGGLILELMNKAIELEPDNGEYYAFRAIVKMNLGAVWEDVLKDYETALEKGVDPMEADIIGFNIEQIKEKKLHAISDAGEHETEA